MADKEKDYSEYKMDNHERYYSLRANNQYLKFDYFSNQVRFDEMKKTIHFFIHHHFIESNFHCSIGSNHNRQYYDHCDKQAAQSNL